MILRLPRVAVGRGAIRGLAAELTQLRVRKPLLMTDRTLSKLGLVGRALESASDEASVVVFDAVNENPVFADADAAATAFVREGCDSVVAFGGGSVIDAAKYVAVIAANGGSASDYAGNPDASFRRGAPLVAIPTTAGTGSEASPDAGIHPDAAAASVGMSSPLIVPDAAILDPELTSTQPPRLTAATGIDALSHCIEGVFSRRRAPLSDALALDGMRRAWRSLETAFRDGSNSAAREDLQLAAFAGGVAIGQGLGPAHAIAIACSDQGYAHGVLSGIGLVCSIDAIAARDPARAAEIARVLGLEDGASLSAAIAAKMRALALPPTLGELGYRMTDLAAAASAACRSPFNLHALHRPSEREYEDMLRASLAG